MLYAGGFIYNPKTSQVLLHLRDNQTSDNPNLWAFFGGLSQENERPEDTFKREILEELDIAVNDLTYLRDYFNPDFDTQRYVFYVILDNPKFKLGEGADAQWFKISEALKLNLSKRTKEDLNYFTSRLKRRG